MKNDFKNWADVYSIIYNQRFENDDEFLFYQSFLDEADGPILEMACGTGRLYTKFLEDGYNIHGSDISEAMLQKTRQKCEEKGLTPTLYHGDSKDISIDTTFSLIYYPFSSLQHLNEGIEVQKQTFQNIYDHLEEGGTFVFDLPVPSFEYVTENYGELQEEFVVEDGVQYKIETWSEISNEAEMNCDLTERVINTETNTIIYESTFELALLPKQQVELLLQVVGFSTYQIHPGYDRDSEFTDANSRMCFVAKK